MRDDMVERVAKAIQGTPSNSSLDQASAAIKAMREPTEDMANAAECAEPFSFEAMWKAAIDAAYAGASRQAVAAGRQVEAETGGRVMKYTTEQLEAISCHFNVFVEQDDDGNVACNTSSPTAETGWRPIFKKQCQEALAAFNAEK